MIIRNVITIKVEGFNQTSLLNTLKDGNIKIVSVKKSNAKELSIDILKKDSRKTFAILQQMCYNYSVSGERGIINCRKYFFKRVGLFASLIVCCFLAVVSQFFVWDVAIVGADELRPEIQKALKEMDIKVGSLKTSFDKKQLDEAVSSITGMQTAVSSLSGSRITIKCFTETPYVFDKPVARDILARFDCIITRIEPLYGEAVVKVGQVVAKGSPVIGAYSMNSNGDKLPSLAGGRVYGKVAFTKTKTFSVNRVRTYRTGNTYTFTTLDVFGLKMWGQPKNPFVEYEVETRGGYAFENNFFPIKYRQSVYYETITEEYELLPEIAASEYLSDIEKQIVVNAKAENIKKSYLITNKSDTEFTVSAFIEAEMLVI